MQLEEDTGIADTQAMLGRIAIERGQFEDAEQLFRSCFSIRKAIGDEEGISFPFRFFSCSVITNLFIARTDSSFAKWMSQNRWTMIGQNTPLLALILND